MKLGQPQNILNMKKFILAFSFILVTLFGFSQTQPVPSVTVTDMEGNKVDISTLVGNGKITIIDFWATWCIPCKKELTNISPLYEDWVKNYNVQLIAVSIDDSRNSSLVKTYVDGSGWDYKVLLDANGDLKHALNFQSVPYVLVVDQNGNIVETHNGYVEGDETLLEDKLIELTGTK